MTTMQKTLQFLIDNICADFTVDSLLGTARGCLAAGPCTTANISTAIRRKDPSLDKGCADGLAEGVVNALAELDGVTVRDATVYPAADRPSRAY